MTSSSSRRFSIGFLMAIIFLIAVQVGFFREFWTNSGSEIAVAVVTFPMANTLLLTLPKLKISVASRPFWIAFQVAGWIMVLIFGILVWLVPEWLFQPFGALMAATGISNADPGGIFVVVPAAVIGYMTPQLLIALLAGRLSSRYRVVIERR